MRYLLVLLILIAVPQVQSAVYKWTDTEGNVQYSDRPLDQAEKLRVPGLTVDNLAAPVKEAASPGEDAAGTNAEEQANKGYIQFEMMEPEQGMTIRSDEGEVAVGILLQPPLQPGHKIHLYLDASPVKNNFISTQLILRKVSRGTHQLEARIIDDQGETHANSPIVNFHMRRASRPGTANN